MQFYQIETIKRKWGSYEITALVNKFDDIGIMISFMIYYTFRYDVVH